MKTYARYLIAAAVACAPFAAAAVNATPIVLNFDALNGAANEGPLNYYNGGLGSDGTGPGPNYGITFSSNTITGVEQPNAGANVNSAGSPSSPNIIFFLSGSAATMNVTNGFDTGFSFYYSAVNNPGMINIWSGLDDTGTLLATLALPTTSNGAGTTSCGAASFCPYSMIGTTFSGIAHSVDFGGTENQVAFDDITLGSATAGATSPAPEPATWMMMILGFGLVGGVMRRAYRKSEEKFTAKVRSIAMA